MELTDFELKDKWTLWFHSVNDNDWSLQGYTKVMNIVNYSDLLFMIHNIKNITHGMFFFMKDGINPIYEDKNNIMGGYWSMRLTKKDSFDYWTKIIFYLCLNNITKNGDYDNKINGLSVSPKINNCIFKIWTSDYKSMKTDYLRKDMEFINFDEIFYLEHKAD